MDTSHALLIAITIGLPLTSFAQVRPDFSGTDFSGTWVLDATASGIEKTVWNQSRPHHLTIRLDESRLTLDTGDGSLFGVSGPVTQSPLVWAFDGPPTTVIDHSLGDIPNFIRKIRTEAHWSDSKLVLLTTHQSETNGAMNSSVTRVWTISAIRSRMLALERTGYRDNRPLTTIPRILHHGRMEDDLIYAKDTAFYTRNTGH